MRMSNYTLKIVIKDDLLKLYKAIVEAKERRISADRLTDQQFADITHAPGLARRAIQDAAVTSVHVAYEQLGRFFYERMEEFEAELDEFQRQLDLRDQGYEADDYD